MGPLDVNSAARRSVSGLGPALQFAVDPVPQLRESQLEHFADE
eukprot:SAG31_NODE_7098_length_1789_cov_1.710651_4_plen_42_part_01